MTIRRNHSNATTQRLVRSHSAHPAGVLTIFFLHTGDTLQSLLDHLHNVVYPIPSPARKYAVASYSPPRVEEVQGGDTPAAGTENGGEKSETPQKSDDSMVIG